ncbi:hypothetical protein [Bradyrhizobium sp. CCBAU 051011]|uniref:hypothetical protein n=1 Tax=Bradyrhizobium sp. CCBAU 051011 TaxID=858422 RepID=UPI00137ABE06|nr:hypothetical protein [Bradyrhizobium sp. CCBAU 051011]
MSPISSDANPAILSFALVSIARAGDAFAEPMTRSTAEIGAKMHEGPATALDALTDSGLVPDIKTTSSVKDACDPQQTAEINRQAMSRARLAVSNIALLGRYRVPTFTLKLENSISPDFMVDGDLRGSFGMKRQ